MILLSEEIFMIFDYCIHNRRYIEGIWIQKCALALNFANAFEIENENTCNNFPLYDCFWSCMHIYLVEICKILWHSCSQLSDWKGNTNNLSTPQTIFANSSTLRLFVSCHIKCSILFTNPHAMAPNTTAECNC